MQSPRKLLNLMQDVNGPESVPAALFASRSLEEERSAVKLDGWPTAAQTLEPLGESILHVSAEGREQKLLEHDGVLIHVGLYGGHVHAVVADKNASRLAPVFAWLRELLPAPDPSATHEVTVTFWTYSPHGPQPSWRSIAVPDWEEIRANYARKTQSQLDEIMRDFRPAHGGQLVLWHGTAGTGKTYALRALAWEWREWCEFHYIVDPDSFFGEHADYLMNVLLQPTYVNLAMQHAVTFQNELGVSEPMIYESADGSDGEPTKAWKLLMLEDTGELLTADAKAVIGQGLSRFLNVVDGLIGQGLRVLVLVTTNEEIRTLHPAVGRPGRCAANVDFAPLSADESARWLSEHGLAREPRGAQILASLYAQLEGRDAREPLPSAGFSG